MVQKLPPIKICIDHEGEKTEKRLTLGTPQGGVLSPLMWNLAFESFLSIFDNSPVRVCGFADDAGLVVKGKDLKQIRNTMQAAINKALEWGKTAGLTFSPSKTVTVIFTRKRKFTTPEPLRLGDMELSYEKDVRYLGVILDNGLHFRKHAYDKIKAAKFKMLRVKNAMGKLWGLPPNMTTRPDF